MTNKQAIKILQKIVDNANEWGCSVDGDIEALDLAISALSDLAVAEEECEQLDKDLVKGDCIYRKSVIQLTREMISAEEYGLMDLLDEVKKLPTIPQPKADGDLISRKEVLELPRIKHEPVKAYGVIEYVDVKDIMKLPTIPQFLCDQDCEHCLFTECPMTTEKSTIPQTDLPDILIKEYLSKCECCDECFAEYFCIKNDLRESREPKDYCVENIRQYLSARTHTIPQTDSETEYWKERAKSYERTIVALQKGIAETQTDLTYDMVEQYAKENGFVIWTKEQTEDTIRKLLNYMDTEKQTDSVLAEIKSEIETLVEAEQQVYGKGSWNFTKKCLEIIDKHISRKESENE